jgi:hypothetical protein
MITRIRVWAGRRWRWAYRFNMRLSNRAMIEAGKDLRIFGTSYTRNDGGGVVRRIAPKDIYLPLGKDGKHGD